jgi:hypothetical protein
MSAPAESAAPAAPAPVVDEKPTETPVVAEAAAEEPKKEEAAPVRPTHPMTHPPTR